LTTCPVHTETSREEEEEEEEEARAGHSEPVHHPLDACYFSVVDELQLS
jgi:hypothetical protein